MPVKQRKAKARAQRITPEVIAAFEARDLWRLHRLLNLDFAHYSPLSRAEIGGYGYPPRQEQGERCILHTRNAAIELRRQILAAIAEEDGRAG